jgi:hypothetical protein
MSPRRRKALFDEGNVPPGGVCLSSFVLVRNGGRVLVGKMAKPEVWTERFFVGEKFAPGYAASRKYLLPARHLAWYESPLEAAEGVLRDMVKIRVPKGSLSLADVQSHVRGDVDSEMEPPHWDICFVYEAKVPDSTVKALRMPAWFSELRFVPFSSLEADDFTRGHGDILQEAQLLSAGQRKLIEA